MLSDDGKPENLGVADKNPSNHMRKGSSGAVGSMMLLKSRRRMHAPFTQVHIQISSESWTFLMRHLLLWLIYKLFHLLNHYRKPH